MYKCMHYKDIDLVNLGLRDDRSHEYSAMAIDTFALETIKSTVKASL